MDDIVALPKSRSPGESPHQRRPTTVYWFAFILRCTLVHRRFDPIHIDALGVIYGFCRRATLQPYKPVGVIQKYLQNISAAPSLFSVFLVTEIHQTSIPQWTSHSLPKDLMSKFSDWLQIFTIPQKLCQLIRWHWGSSEQINRNEM